MSEMWARRKKQNENKTFLASFSLDSFPLSSFKLVLQSRAAMKENVYRVVVVKIYIVSAWVQMMSPKQFHLIMFKKTQNKHPIVFKKKRNLARKISFIV